jgi:hypothetical protein
MVQWNSPGFNYSTWQLLYEVETQSNLIHVLFWNTISRVWIDMAFVQDWTVYGANAYLIVPLLDGQRVGDGQPIPVDLEIG